VHDLKHTFGRRLRAVGVSFADRQDLLGHRSGRITTHYSAAELSNLIEAAERVCGEASRKTPGIVLLKKKAPAPSLVASACSKADFLARPAGFEPTTPWFVDAIPAGKRWK